MRRNSTVQAPATASHLWLAGAVAAVSAPVKLRASLRSSTADVDAPAGGATPRNDVGEACTRATKHASRGTAGTGTSTRHKAQGTGTGTGPGTGHRAQGTGTGHRHNYGTHHPRVTARHRPRPLPPSPAGALHAPAFSSSSCGAPSSAGALPSAVGAPPPTGRHSCRWWHRPTRRYRLRPESAVGRHQAAGQGGPRATCQHRATPRHLPRPARCLASR